MNHYPIKRKIIRNLITISRCMTSLTDLGTSKYGISRGQHSYMIRIIESPGYNQNDYSRMLKVNKAAVSNALKILEKENYIRREVNEADKRNNKIYPTEKLLDKYSILYKVVADLSNICFEDFSENEIQQYYMITKRIKQNINKYWLEKFGYDNAYLDIDEDM